MKKKKITLLVSNVSTNAFGRANLLAEMLEPEFDIEFAGFHQGGLWPPCYGIKWPVRSLQMPLGSVFSKNYRKSITALAKLVSGDLVIACKAWPWIIDTVKILQKKYDKPCIYDIDDWELAWSFPLSVKKILREIIFKKFNPHGLLMAAVSELRIRFSDTPVIVSNTFLQDRFNGMIIPHACNTEFLDPARVLSKDECRVKYFLKKNAFYLAFVGTPRGHKGLDMILDFLHKHSTPDLRLLIAGIQDQEIKSSFYDKCRSKIDFITTFSRKNLPEIIKAIDVSLILQKDLACCKGQLPAKLFDAMAMEKPVIASAVSDIPEILDGCGITITPDNMQEFEKAVKKIRDNKENAFQMGKKGRIKCIQKYSQKVVSERLKKYVNQILFKK